MQMITVSPEARDYILENGGAVTIRMIKGQAGCCTMLSPVVETSHPSDTKRYRTIVSDNITLYLQNDLEIMPGGIAIGLNKLLWVKKLDIHGLDILP